MKLTHYTTTGTKSTKTVSDGVFGAKVNQALLSQVLYVYMSNKRQGTSKVKTRSEVDVSHKKIYSQKGTGNARHGSKNAPIFVGGGRAHGPTGMENWSKSLSKNMKKAALISALSAQAENIFIHEGLTELKGKTKAAAELIKSIEAKKKVLVVLAARSEAVERSLRNIANVIFTTADDVSAFDIAKANKIVMTSETIETLEKRLTSKTSAKQSSTEKTEETKTRAKAKARAKTETKSK